MTENDGATKMRIPLREMREQRAALRIEIVNLLTEGGNAWMTAGEIAAEVNRRGNCSRPDGRAITIQQICRQTRNYANVFERMCVSIRLRESYLEQRDDPSPVRKENARTKPG